MLKPSFKNIFPKVGASGFFLVVIGFNLLIKMQLEL